MPSDAVPAATLAPYTLCERVAHRSVRNFFAELVGTFFTAWLGTVFRTAALGLFWLFVAITAFDALQVAGITLAGFALLTTKASRTQGQGWVWAANAVRIASLAIACALLLFLKGKLWPSSPG